MICCSLVRVYLHQVVDRSVLYVAHSADLKVVLDHLIDFRVKQFRNFDSRYFVLDTVTHGLNYFLLKIVLIVQVFHRYRSIR